IQATFFAIVGRRGRFVVTPKRGQSRPQIRPVLPALALLAALAGAAGYGLWHSHSPATLNNVAFAAMHIAVLLAGVWGGLVPSAPAPEAAAAGPGAREPSVRKRLERVAA